MSETSKPDIPANTDNIETAERWLGNKDFVRLFETSAAIPSGTFDDALVDLGIDSADELEKILEAVNSGELQFVRSLALVEDFFSGDFKGDKDQSGSLNQQFLQEIDEISNYRFFGFGGDSASSMDIDDFYHFWVKKDVPERTREIRKEIVIDLRLSAARASGEDVIRKYSMAEALEDHWDLKQESVDD